MTRDKGTSPLPLEPHHPAPRPQTLHHFLSPGGLYLKVHSVQSLVQVCELPPQGKRRGKEGCLGPGIRVPACPGVRSIVGLETMNEDLQGSGTKVVRAPLGRSCYRLHCIATQPLPSPKEPGSPLGVCLPSLPSARHSLRASGALSLLIRKTRL